MFLGSHPSLLSALINARAFYRPWRLAVETAFTSVLKYHLIMHM